MSNYWALSNRKYPKEHTWFNITRPIMHSSPTQTNLFWHFPSIYSFQCRSKKDFIVCTRNLRQNSYNYLLLYRGRSGKLGKRVGCTNVINSWLAHGIITRFDVWKDRSIFYQFQYFQVASVKNMAAVVNYVQNIVVLGTKPILWKIILRLFERESWKVAFN